MHTCILVADNGDIDRVLDPWIYDPEPVRPVYDVLPPWWLQKEDVPAVDPPKPRKPQAEYDYCAIGGRYDGALPLKKPRTVYDGFGAASEESQVSVAKKSEIDQQAFFQMVPGALYYRGALYKAAPFATGEALDKWRAEFIKRFAEIPEDITLQIVDAHS